MCQELVATGKVVPYYWSAENSSGEVDFVYDYGRSIVAVEAKATTNLKAKSLRLFVERNHLGRGLRLSLSPFKEQDWVVNLPLYAAGLLPSGSHRCGRVRSRINPHTYTGSRNKGKAGPNRVRLPNVSTITK